MNRSILQTKLFVPSIHAECIPRPQLIARLNRGLPGKLTLVSAPAGFGKTTLVVDWITRLREVANRPVGGSPRCCWLSLDEEDNQFTRFCTYLIAALQRADEGCGEAARSLLQSPQPVSIPQLVTLLINDLAVTTQEAPVLLVLDDYHLLRDQEIHQALTYLLEHAPPGFHLVLITRSDPPLPLAQMRVRREMTEIRQAELRFTPDETHSLLNQTGSIHLPDRQVAALAKRTEGWVAALQLAAMALQSQDADEQAEFVASFSGGHTHVVDYLLDQVWRQQPEAVQTFLIATSILEELCGALCDAVTGREDGAQMLVDLYRRNLFLVPLDAEHHWYRFHRLFVDMLRMRAADQGPDAIRRGHQQAARWYEAQENLPRAIHHALSAQDLPGATRLIGLATEAALSQGEIAALQGWLDALPAGHVRGHHQLALARAWVAYLNGRADTAGAYVAAAQDNWPERADPAQTVSLLSLQSLLAVLRGEHEAGLAHAEEALELAPEQDSLHGLLLLNLMQAQAALGAIGDATETGYKAARTAFDEDNAFLAAAIQDGLLQLLLLQGSLYEVIGRGEEMVGRFVDGRNRPLPTAGQLYITLGQAHFEKGDFDRARSLIRKGIGLSEKMAAMMAVSKGRLSLAQIEAARGEDEAALALLHDVRGLPIPAHLQLLAAALEAGVRLQQGDTAAALAWANSADIPGGVPILGFESVYLVYVRCLLAGRRWAEADALLAEMAAAAREQGRPGSLVSILLLQALSRHAQGDAAAEELVREAVVLGAAEDQQRPFLEALPELAPLLHAAREAAPQFVTSLLRRVDLPEQAAGQVNLPEPLNDREIEILRLIDAGHSNPQIARELYLSVNTVKWYVKQIFQKLNVSSRHEAAAQARARGLL